jgi:histidine triad (HIT) family protein
MSRGSPIYSAAQMHEQPGAPPAQDCVFCEIIASRVGASVAHEDDATLVFADLRQPSAGHLLVVPKRHVEQVYDLDPETAARLMQMVVLTARAMRQALQPEGLSIWQSNGGAAGQEVPHVHVHLLARSAGDGLLRVYPERPPYPDRNALDQLAAAIKAGFAAG